MCRARTSPRAHRWPQMPMASMIGQSSLPASVNEYSTAWPSWVDDADVSSVLSRFDSSDGDISGTPRRRSLNRVLPHRSSRITRGVQRSVSTSDAIATGQNWP